jgi:hypothetical protein
MSRTWQHLSRISDGRPSELSVYAYQQDHPAVRLERNRGRAGVVGALESHFTIHSVGSLLLPTHVMRTGDRQVWSLAARSPLRNRYTLQPAGEAEWLIKTPFFSVAISGQSESGAKLEGCIGRTRTEWLFSFEGRAPSTEFLAAVAWLHWFSYFHT